MARMVAAGVPWDAVMDLTAEECDVFAAEVMRVRGGDGG